MNPRALLSILLLVCFASGCAHASPRQRLARTLVASGAALSVLGVLTTAGCVDSNHGSGCSGDPSSVDLGAGIPVVALGAALITAGFIVKPPRSSRLFKPTTPQPIPVLPDPFVPNMPQY